MTNQLLVSEMFAATPGWTSPVVQPGSETEALRRFHWDCTWTGTVEPGMMGPGSPKMDAIGKASFTWVVDGLVVMGIFEQDQFADGEHILTWKAHYLAGWDPQAQAYRAFLADNCGHLGFMQGQIADERLVMETVGDGPARFRITWDLSDSQAPVWLNEVSVAGNPWQLVEQYTLVPSNNY